MKLRRLYGAHYRQFCLLNNLRDGSKPHLTSGVHLLHADCFVQGPRTDCKTVHSMPYPVHFVLIQFEF
jgi:hypothetical protein